MNSHDISSLRHGHVSYGRSLGTRIFAEDATGFVPGPVVGQLREVVPGRSVGIWTL